MLKIFISLLVIILIIIIIIRKIKMENEVGYKHKSALETLAEMIEEHPEFVETIVKENKKKAEEQAKEDAKYNFPIKRSEAIQIAKKDSNLKTDFCKNSKRKRYFLSFIS